MYKIASRNLQRSHRVIDVRKPVGAYICEDDLIATAGNMTLEQCEAERASLLLERARAENEMAGAKRAGRHADQKAIGHRLQNLSQRLGLVRDRMKELNRQRSRETLYDAAADVLPPDLFRKVLDRARELNEQRNPTPGATA